MRLSDDEIREITSLLDEGKALPDEYRLSLELNFQELFVKIHYIYSLHLRNRSIKN